MAPERIIIIRHAEHHDEPGFKEDGTAGQRSLTIRGWQRAGALVGLFGPSGHPDLVPATVFASAIGQDSPSDRPAETVSPLCEVLRSRRGFHYDRTYLKPDAEGLMRDVMQRSGSVLICWEHSVIPTAIAALPHAPTVPDEWPGGRYDLIWILDRHGPGWRFAERSQGLLAGDTEPVATT